MDPTAADCTYTGPAASATSATTSATTKGTLMTERTVAHAVSEISYGVQFASLNERFWSHLDTGLNLVQIGFGALALSGALALNGTVAAVAGVSLAIVSALQLTLSPCRRSFAFRDARMAFHELKKRAWALDLISLDAEIEDLRKSAPQGLRALAAPAQNIVHEAVGQPPAFPNLSPIQRLALALA